MSSTPQAKSTTFTTGCWMNTTKTAENLPIVSKANNNQNGWAYAAVAVKISTLDVDALVKNISPIEKTVANPARHNRRLFSPFTLDKTVIAMVGKRQATTVDTDEVNFSIRFSEYVASVSCWSFFLPVPLDFFLGLLWSAFSRSSLAALILRILLCLVKLLWNGTKSFATHFVKPSTFRCGRVATRSSPSVSEEGGLGHNSRHSMVKNWRGNDIGSLLSCSNMFPHVDSSPFPPMQKSPPSCSLSHVLRVLMLQSSGAGRAEIWENCRSASSWIYLRMVGINWHSTTHCTPLRESSFLTPKSIAYQAFLYHLENRQDNLRDCSKDVPYPLHLADGLSTPVYAALSLNLLIRTGNTEDFWYSNHEIWRTMQSQVSGPLTMLPLANQEQVARGHFPCFCLLYDFEGH